MIDRSRLHVVVRGRVQGVGFRRFVQRVAVAHDLAGWVANRADGSVEVMAEGTAESIELLRADLGRGPPGAAVHGVEPVRSDVQREALRPFAIRHG